MKLRSEIDKSLTWDLSQIFENEAAWEAAYAEAAATVETIPAIKGTLGA